jgi:hypothetical protein
MWIERIWLTTVLLTCFADHLCWLCVITAAGMLVASSLITWSQNSLYKDECIIKPYSHDATFIHCSVSDVWYFFFKSLALVGQLNYVMLITAASKSIDEIAPCKVIVNGHGNQSRSFDTILYTLLTRNNISYHTMPVLASIEWYSAYCDWSTEVAFPS